MATKLSYFLTILVFVSASNYTLVTPTFDYFNLVLQWPNTVCHHPRYPCQRIPLPQDFNIHGLWPENYTARLQYCSHSLGIVLPSIRNDTLKQMLNASWSDLFVPLTMSGENFWHRQWVKHGSCSANLYNRDEYLQKALDLKGRFNLLAILGQNGITPQTQHTVSRNKINSSIVGATGQVPILKCSHRNWLNEIVICFNPTGVSVIPCPLPPPGSRGICPNYVMFP